MEKKNTAQFKYVIKYELLGVTTLTQWSYAKNVVLRGYWNASEPT